LDLRATNELLTGLPGEALVRQGLADANGGRCTIPACLVFIARPRLQRAGLIHGDRPMLPTDAELELYRLLRQEGGDAYSRYNALLGELVSFEQALDRRVRTRAMAELAQKNAKLPKNAGY
jgi:hypothetical protein